MRGQPLFLRNQPDEVVVHFRHVDRREAKPLESRNSCENAPDHLPKAWPPRQVLAIAG